jgi:DNA-directed RNA polymerase subunit E'/Rpb7
MLTRTIAIDINNIGSNLLQVIDRYMEFNYEGKCCKEGYIQPGTIQIRERSAGKIVNDTNIEFVVVFECMVCFPVDGDIINCTALNVTKAGIRAEISNESPSPVVVFVARDHSYNDEAFSQVKEGQNISVKVIGHRFELNDKHISVIGRLL